MLYGKDPTLLDAVGREDRRSPLLCAAANGRVQAFRFLAGAAGVDLKARDRDGCSAAHFAAAAGNSELLAVRHVPMVVAVAAVAAVVAVVVVVVGSGGGGGGG